MTDRERIAGKLAEILADYGDNLTDVDDRVEAINRMAELSGTARVLHEEVAGPGHYVEGIGYRWVLNVELDVAPGETIQVVAGEGTTQPGPSEHSLTGDLGWLEYAIADYIAKWGEHWTGKPYLGEYGPNIAGMPTAMANMAMTVIHKNLGRASGEGTAPQPDHADLRGAAVRLLDLLDSDVIDRPQTVGEVVERVSRYGAALAEAKATLRSLAERGTAPQVPADTLPFDRATLERFAATADPEALAELIEQATGSKAVSVTVTAPDEVLWEGPAYDLLVDRVGLDGQLSIAAVADIAHTSRVRVVAADGAPQPEADRG